MPLGRRPGRQLVLLPRLARSGIRAILGVILSLAGALNLALGAPLPTGLMYQGRLVFQGVPAQGLYDLIFTLYDAPTGGASVAGSLTNRATPVTNGLFTVTLDFGQAALGAESRWLEVLVRGEADAEFTALAPRQLLTAAPHAVYALRAGQAPPPSFIPTLAVGALSVSNYAMQLGVFSPAWGQANSLTFTRPDFGNRNEIRFDHLDPENDGVIRWRRDTLDLGFLSRTDMRFVIDSVNTATNRFFSWSRDANNYAGPELMRLTESGWLGLQTNLPRAALHVGGGGSALVEGSLTALGGITTPGDLTARVFTAQSADVAMNRNTLLVVVGDSLSNDYNDWPNLHLTTNGGWLARCYRTNFAVGGRTAATMDALFDTTVATVAPRNQDEAWLCVWGGINDIYGGAPASAVYGHLTNLWRRARDLRFKTVAFTLLKPTAAFLDSTREAERVQLNRLIESDPTLYDYLVRAHLVLPDASDTNYFADAVHPNALGSALIAREVAHVLGRETPWTLVGCEGSPTAQRALVLKPSGGQVGINTLSPRASLHVGQGGDAVVEGSVAVGSSLTIASGTAPPVLRGTNTATLWASNQTLYWVWADPDGATNIVWVAGPVP